MAQMVNIPLNSHINTTDDGLFADQPSWDFKNTLVYRGIAENIKVSSGDGILSTTSKKIQVKDGVLEAGSQSFSLPSDYYTVQNTGSKSIGENEVCINGVVAGANKSYFYIGDVRTNWPNNKVMESVWVAPLQNTNSFIFFGIYDNDKINIFVDTSAILLDVSFYGGLKEYGKVMTACKWHDHILIGFDDNDYRKRGLFVSEGLNLTFLPGFGCVNNKGWVTGEPIPVEIKDTTRTPINVLGGTPAIKGNICGPKLDRQSYGRYKVLDNGAISMWTGWFNQDAKCSLSTEKTCLELIADENSKLGASITDKNSTQAEVGNWHWKLHATNGIKNTETPEGQVGKDKFVDPNGVVRNGPDWGENYWYGEGAASPDYQGVKDREIFQWLFGYELTSYGLTSLRADLDVYDDTTPQSYMNCSSFKHINIYGDWTYGYNSMKAFKDLTDYDSVFPYLRLFFNVSGSKGKYYEYGPGWIKAYHYDFAWSYCNKEVVAVHKPIDIYNYREGSRSIREANPNICESRDTLKLFAESDAASLPHAGNFIEPFGNVRFSDWTFTDNEPWRKKQEYLSSYPDYFKKTGDVDLTPFTDWVAYKPYDYWSRNGFGPFRRLQIKGSGVGIQEETFNFGGLGDDSLLGVCSNTINITPDFTQVTATGGTGYFDIQFDNNDKLRLGIYQNLNMSLSYAGTLLFNAADLGEKFHIYKDGDDYVITIYNDKKAQWLRLKKNGEIKVDKLTDYMFRVNIVGHENLLIESRDGIFSFIKGFNSFIGENAFYVADLQLKAPTGDTSSNNTLLYADGINVNLLTEDTSPSFLLPAKSFASYINTSDMTYFESTVLKNRHGFIKNKLRNSNITEGVEVYYTSLLSSADLSYKETDKLPDTAGDFEGCTGIQEFERDMEGYTYWIDSKTVIYPVAIGSEVSGINYQTSTIDLPGNYAVRFYTQNNKTWPVYNQNAQVYFGNNIFTIMGSNYYFDGQGVYYLGDSKYGGATGQYAENILIAYAIGMKYLCNAPSEAYFYSPFDRCLYIFTSSNTMQKSTSLSRFGDIIDSCYCPVNQALYILFDGKLMIKTQDDMAIIDVEGNTLQTTADGVQVVNNGDKFTIHSPYLYEEMLPLHIETEWLGNPDTLSKYSYCDLVLFGSGEVNVAVDLQTIAGTKVTGNLRHLHIKENDWQNNHYRIRLTAKEPVGNAFKIILKSDDKVALYNMCMYMDQVSQRAGAVGRA